MEAKSSKVLCSLSSIYDYSKMYSFIKCLIVLCKEQLMIEPPQIIFLKT